jgi:Protein of unknown function (DUF2752)
MGLRRSMLPSFLASRQLRLTLLVLLAVILMPPEDGLGIDLCVMRNFTGAPCPGCGVTRSCSNFFRGRFRRSVQFHPLGLIFAPVLLGLAVLSLLPAATRKLFAERLSRYDRLLVIASILFWTVFFIYGAVRWFAVMAGYIAFPPSS